MSIEDRLPLRLTPSWWQKTRFMLFLWVPYVVFVALIRQPPSTMLIALALAPFIFVPVLQKLFMRKIPYVDWRHVVAREYDLLVGAEAESLPYLSIKSIEPYSFGTAWVRLVGGEDRQFSMKGIPKADREPVIEWIQSRLGATVFD